MQDQDLFSEFIDILRQCGCTEDNDVQVRYGTRVVLASFIKGGYQWMNDKNQDSDYSKIHVPWTATPAVRKRIFDPVVPGSIGYAFEKALHTGSAKDEEYFEDEGGGTL